jgi:hypothetical protein
MDHRPDGVRRRGRVLGPGGLDVLPLSLTSEAVLTITELTLALLLFSVRRRSGCGTSRAMQVCPLRPFNYPSSRLWSMP